MTRSALLERLDDVLDRPLVMLTGPAGSGKSTLVAQWCRDRCPIPVAWCELTHADDDPHLLMRGVLDVVHEVTGSSVGDGPDDWLADGGSLLDPSAVDRLANVVTDAPEVVVVVDGLNPQGPIGLYADIARAFERAERCGIHMLTMSRCVPPPELTPLQLRRAATHIDQADLRLEAEQVAAVVNAYSGRQLRGPVAEALTNRLDGWMAAAVIVGLSHPGGDDVAADDLVGAAFDGIDAYVTSEILSDLPDDLRTFLLRTACVDEMTAALCDLVTGRTDSDRVLSMLRSFGLPVVRGGATAGSFQYQRPFREVVDAHARRDDPDTRDAALRAAAEWYSRQHRPFDAAWCWVRLGEWDEVLKVLLQHLQYILENDLFSEVVEIVDATPPEQMRRHHAVTTAAAWFLRMDGRVAAAMEMLSVHQSWMPDRQRIVTDLSRGSTASWVDDVSGPLGFAEASIARCDELGDNTFDDIAWYTETPTDMYRAMSHAAAALACCYGGFWQRGASHLVDTRAETKVHMPTAYLVQMHGWRATYLVMAGETDRALADARQALTIMADSNLDRNRCSADALYAFGEAQRLSLQHDGVAESFQRSLAMSEINGRRNLTATIAASQAHLLVDTGRPDDAVALLERRSPDVRRLPRAIAGNVAAANARALAATGAHARALRHLDLTEQTPTTAACRVAICLAVGDLAQARQTVEHWPKQPTVDSVVRAALAAAVVADAAGETKTADAAFRSALTAAAEHQLLQPLIEVGGLISRLLRRAGGERTNTAEVEVARRVQALLASGTIAGIAPRFTARETIVLSHLAAGRSVAEVASEIHLSVNTVKTYVKAIYRKLGVNSRAEAINAWNALRSSGVDD